MKFLIITIFCIMLSGPAFSEIDLSIFGAGYCYTDCTWSGCLVAKRINCQGQPCIDLIDQSIDYCIDDYNSTSMPCLHPRSNDDVYFVCTSNSDELACETANSDFSLENNTKTIYKTLSYTNHSLSSFKIIYTQEEEGDNECFINANAPQYGCMVGYYPTANAGTTNVVCGPCPDGGTSDNFNTSKTGCYLPASATGSDNTGTYTISGGKCYWKN